MDRRSFMKVVLGTGAGAAGFRLSGPLFSEALGLPAGPFQYGVASGDPLPDRVVIWSRVTPSPEATPGSGLGAPTPVTWIVASDSALTDVVASGTVTTSPDSDHTVKVDVDGLSPATAYFYGFRVGTDTSPVGRTKTAPAIDADNAGLRFGLVSCSNYAQGYFSAYRHLATRNDLDFVLHVGDYIYEYGNGQYGSFRAVDPPTEILTLEDYRRRHALYRSDPDLAALHARYPFILTIDDHEVTNDAWRDGAENHQPGEGDYPTRRGFAYRAYFEWLPIRDTLPDPIFYRRLQFGSLADVTMLDLRSYRDQQVTTIAEAADPARTMLGADQEAFVVETVLPISPSPRWRLIGNSVQAMQVRYPAGFLADGTGTFRNVDAWDGYVAARTELLSLIAASDGSWDAVFLTGDIHSSWAADLPIDFDAYPTSPSVATEFVCTSVTSDNLNEIVGLPPRSPTSLGFEAAIRARNPHVKLVEFDSHGYSVVDVTAERVQCDWYYISDRQDPNATSSFATAKQTLCGAKAVAATDPAGPVVDAGPPPVIPEVPVAALLPVAAAAALVGGAVVLRRRAEQTVHAPG